MFLIKVSLFSCFQLHFHQTFRSNLHLSPKTRFLKFLTKASIINFYNNLFKFFENSTASGGSSLTKPLDGPPADPQKYSPHLPNQNPGGDSGISCGIEWQSALKIWVAFYRLKRDLYRWFHIFLKITGYLIVIKRKFLFAVYILIPPSRIVWGSWPFTQGSINLMSSPDFFHGLDERGRILCGLGYFIVNVIYICSLFY